MRYKTVSRKRGVSHRVEIVPHSSGRWVLTLGLPADIQNVERALQRHLPRSTASWRTRQDYERVFRVVDALGLSRPKAKHKTKREVAISELGISTEPEGSLRVKDCENTFKKLAHRLLPSVRIATSF